MTGSGSKDRTHPTLASMPSGNPRISNRPHRETRLVAEKFVLSTFPRAMTKLSSMGSRAVRA